MIPLRVAALTVSDGCFRGTREDVSGARIADWARECGHELVARSVVPDETEAIVRAVLSWCDRDGLDLVVTTGGTGFTDRDVTPEATRALLDREAPGIVAALMREGLAGTPFAALSRGLAGLRGRTLIVNLPGSPGAVVDGLRVLSTLAPHVRDLLRGMNTSRHPGGASGGPSPDEEDRE